MFHDQGFEGGHARAHDGHICLNNSVYRSSDINVHKCHSGRRMRKFLRPNVVNRVSIHVVHIIEAPQDDDKAIDAHAKDARCGATYVSPVNGRRVAESGRRAETNNKRGQKKKINAYKPPVPRMPAITVFCTTPTRRGFSSQMGSIRSTRSMKTLMQTIPAYHGLGGTQSAGRSNVQNACIGRHAQSPPVAPMIV